MKGILLPALVLSLLGAGLNAQDEKPRQNDRIDPYVFGGCTAWFNYEDAVRSEIGGDSDDSSVGCSVGFGFPTFDSWGLEFSYGQPPNIQTLQTVPSPSNNEVKVQSKQGTEYWSLKTLVERGFNDRISGIAKLGISYTSQSLTARPVTEDTDDLPVVSEKKSYMDPTISLGLKFRMIEAKTAPRGALDLVVLYTKHLNADIFSDGVEINFRVSFTNRRHL